MKKDLQERERVLASYNQKEIDNPMILPAGEYKEKQKHLQQQWRDECRDYYLGVMQRGVMSESGLTLICMSTKPGSTLICTTVVQSQYKVRADTNICKYKAVNSWLYDVWVFLA